MLAESARGRAVAICLAAITVGSALAAPWTLGAPAVAPSTPSFGAPLASSGAGVPVAPPSTPSYPYEVQNASAFCGNVASTTPPSVPVGAQCYTNLTGVTAGDALIFELSTSFGCSGTGATGVTWGVPRVFSSPALGTPALNVTALSGSAITNTLCSWTWVWLSVPGGSESLNFTTVYQCPSSCGSNSGAALYDDYWTALVEVHGASGIDAVSAPVASTSTTSIKISYATNSTGDFLYSTLEQLRCTGGTKVPAGWAKETMSATGQNTCGNVGGGGPAFSQNATKGSSSATFTATQGTAAAGRIIALSGGIAVTFRETGLVAGTSWSVSLGSTTNTTAAPGNNVFLEPNGNYTFTLGVTSGYTPSPSTGTLTVHGAAVNQSITFHPPAHGQYVVTFTESGLASGTLWGVSMNGTTVHSLTSSLVFLEPNGSYAYNVSPISGYTTAWTGHLTVVGSAKSQAIAFAPVTYTVVFSESGLPARSAGWGVTLGSSAGSALAGASISFSGVTNGTYAYNVTTTLSTYDPVVPAGTLKVAGSPPVPAVLVDFTLAPVSVQMVQNASSYCGNLGSPAVIAGQDCNTTLTGVAGGDSLIFQTVTSMGCTPAPTFLSSPALGAPAASYSESAAPMTSYSANGPTAYCSWTLIWFGVAAAASLTIYFVTSPCTTSCISGVTDDYLTFLSEVSGAVSVDSASAPVSTPTPSASTTLTYRANATGDLLYSSFVQLRCTGGAHAPAGWALLASAGGQGNYCGNVGGSSPWYLENATVGAGSATFTSNYATAGAGRILALKGGYAVTFNESGLASGTTWSVTLGGVTVTAVAPATITFAEPVGNFSYTVGAIAHFRAVPSTGYVNVSGKSVLVGIAFASPSLFPVTFNEAGLPIGTSWTVALNKNSSSSTTAFVSFVVGNGTFAYSVGGIAGYRANAYSGTVTVRGRAVSVSITFTPTVYTLEFTETGLALGTPWSVTLSPAQTNSTRAPGANTFVETNGSYTYTVAAVANYSVSPTGGTVSVAGSGSVIPIAFKAPYSVTFTETGLPSGTNWGVTLSGILERSTKSAIAFTALNGSHAYNISGLPGWQANRYAGTAVVAGASVAVGIDWSGVNYSVTVTESGLPSGTTWSVAVGGTPEIARAPAALGFILANGTFPYTVLPIANYTTSHWSGSVTVNGAATSLAVPFTLVTYAVTFGESSLPPATPWSVTLGGTTATNATGGSIVFQEPNGTYAYTVGAVAGYRAKWAGSVAVNGQAVATSVPFTEVTYPIVFNESGLSTGASWSITLSGVTHTSAGKSITISEPNGTYPYTVGAPSGYAANRTGSVTVAAAAATVTVPFTTFDYLVAFNETGLPAGASWSVQLAGQPGAGSTYFESRNSTASTIAFSAPNGTYSFQVAVPAGYSANPSAGAVRVDAAAPAPTAITVTSSAPSPAALPWTWIIVGAVAVVAAGAAVVLWRMPRGRPRAAARERPSPPRGSPPAAGPKPGPKATPPPSTPPASEEEEHEIYGSSG